MLRMFPELTARFLVSPGRSNPLARWPQAWVVAGALALVFSATPTAMAGTIQVGLPFSGQCSLRSAIQTANTNVQTGGCIRSGSSEPDIIQLQAGAYVIETGLSPPYIDEDANVEGDYDITSAVVLQGVSPERTAIEGAPLDRVFDVLSPGSLTLQDVTVYGGNVSTTAAADGGAIRKNINAALNLTRVLIHGGTATRGGAIYATMQSGAFSLSEVTITGAFASVFGGAVFADGGTSVAATPTLTNVTLSGNTAQLGSAIFLSAAKLLMINSTIAFNRSTGSGGALHYSGQAPARTVELANSILTENTRNTGAGADVACSNALSLALRTHTLMSTVQNCTFDTTVATPSGTDARLLPLFDHGGGIPVHSFSSGSAALGAGLAGLCPDSDARGVARTGACDIGAYEVMVDLQINSTADLPDLVPGDGLCRASGNVCTLRAASMEANARGGRWFVSLPAGTYTLNQPIASADDAGGDLDFKPNSATTPPLAFTLLGQGASNTHIVGTGSDRVIEVRGRYDRENSGRFHHRKVSFALFNVTVRGGNLSRDTFRLEPDEEPVAGGGIHVIGGHALFHRVVVRNNQLRFVDDGPNSPFNSARGAGVSIDVSGVDADYFRYISSARFDHFAVVDNTGLITPDTYSVQGGGMAVFGTSSDEPGIGGEAVLINGTIAGNQAYAYSGLFASNVQGSFLTIHGNQVMETINPSFGAGVVSSGPRGSLRNSIIAGNLLGGQPRDCTGTINTLGHVLVGSDVDCVFSGDTTGNQLNVDPLLGPRLVDANGMPFHRASAGSPAIDVIAASRCVDHGSIGVSSDALGAVRPWIEDPRCDIGSIEGAALAEVIFAGGFED
jgi:hypothetical protein